jgi:hypothetical protein
VAETVTRDPYAATREILTMGEEIPVVVGGCRCLSLGSSVLPRVAPCR